ncbi:MAG: TetR/AcrR family transcriptional regulator [Myxococcota bacterium]
MVPTRDPVPPRAPDSRDKILETAEGLFAIGGYVGVGMRELATTVGLSKSALFHHFPNKQELYSAVLDRSLVRIEAAVNAVGTEGTPEEQLDAWIDAVVCTLSEDVPAGRLMMRALVDEEPFPAIVLQADAGLDRELEDFELRLAGILERFGALLEAGVASGAFRPVSIPDTLLSVIGAITFHFSSGELGEALLGESVFSRSAVERRRREVAQFIRRGLMA